MAILAHSLYDKYSYFLGAFPIGSPLVKVGRYCKLDTQGYLQLADPGEAGFIAQWPKEREITNSKTGLAVNKASLVFGNFSIVVDTDSIEIGRHYAPGQQLVIGTGGKLTNNLDITPNPTVVAVCLGVYVKNKKGYMRIASTNYHKAIKDSQPTYAKNDVYIVTDSNSYDNAGKFTLTAELNKDAKWYFVQGNLSNTNLGLVHRVGTDVPAFMINKTLDTESGFYGLNSGTTKNVTGESMWISRTYLVISTVVNNKEVISEIFDLDLSHPFIWWF